jgi:hypothetical protein
MSLKFVYCIPNGKLNTRKHCSKPTLNRLLGRLRAAEAAISKRLEVLAGESNHQEGQALKDALHTVQGLRTQEGAL